MRQPILLRTIDPIQPAPSDAGRHAILAAGHARGLSAPGQSGPGLSCRGAARVRLLGPGCRHRAGSRGDSPHRARARSGPHRVFADLPVLIVRYARASVSAAQRMASAATSQWAATSPVSAIEQTLELVPELDSVVRFEGETTLIELVDAVSRAETGVRFMGSPTASETGRDHTRAPLLEDLDRTAVSGPRLRTGSGARAKHHADSRQSRLCSHLFLLLDPHLLPRRARAYRPDAETR